MCKGSVEPIFVYDIKHKSKIEWIWIISVFIFGFGGKKQEEEFKTYFSEGMNTIIQYLNVFKLILVDVDTVQFFPPLNFRERQVSPVVEITYAYC